MADLEDRIWLALKTVKFPGMSRDIVSFGFVEKVTADGGRVGIVLQMTTHNEEAVARVRDEVERAAAAVEGAESVEVELKVSRPQARPPGGPQAGAQQAVSRDAELLPNVEHVVAVASGKGGVGKSTVAANLALALAKLGHRVGILDADIYGPSMPMMFGITDRPRIEANRVIPFERYGVKVMSLGFVVDTDTPVIWRGPMVMKALEQLMGDVDWGELDYMIVDLPPGTSDAPLTVMQTLNLDGFIVVTSPQELAALDAKRSINMIKKMNLHVFGIVENFSGELFGTGAGEELADEMGLPFLGRTHMRMEYRDATKPPVLASEDIADEYQHITAELRKQVEKLDAE